MPSQIVIRGKGLDVNRQYANYFINTVVPIVEGLNLNYRVRESSPLRYHIPVEYSGPKKKCMDEIKNLLREAAIFGADKKIDDLLNECAVRADTAEWEKPDDIKKLSRQFYSAGKLLKRIYG